MQAGNLNLRLIEAMKQPDFYPEKPARVEFRQTHISCVFLAGDFVYKVKKPVHLDFLNAYTVGDRFRLCREEVRLNRRFAPSVYLGVVPIIEHGDHYALGGLDELYHPHATEYAVKMRRLPEDRMLDHLLRHGIVTADAIAKVANRIAEVHRNASTACAWRYGSSAAVERTVLGNLYECRRHIGQTISEEAFDAIEAYLSGFVAAHRSQLNNRVRGGHVREGHGDLRCEHVCLNENIDIFDCVEFDEKFRYVDIASDLAFLAMDLDSFGFPRLSDHLVRNYSEHAGDSEFASLITFYKCYRACVRGKVDSLKSLAPEVPAEERERARERGRAKFSLAAHYAAMGKPSLLAVCGLVASGKSTVAEMIRLRTGFEVLNSDRIRKQLAGIPETLHQPSDYGAGIYTAAFDRLTYDTMIEEARHRLSAGRGVILDATFKDPRHRLAVRALAHQMDVPVAFVECRLGEEETVRRLQERIREGRGVSDAGQDIYEQMKKDYAPLTEIPAREHLVINTADDTGAELDRLETALGHLSR